MQALDLSYLSSTITVMLLPLQTDNLFLPDVMVAEVKAVGDIDVPAKAPDWLVGNIRWRGQVVPLISFEALNGAMASAPETVKYIAIINSMADHGHLPYYAIATTAEPKILDVSDQELMVNEARPRGRAEAMSIAVDEHTGGIPNVEWVEQHLLAYMLHG